MKAITEEESHLIGTVRFSNVDATNRHYLKTAIEQLKESPRGSWLLVHAYDKVGNYDQLQRQHASLQRRLPKNQRTPFIPPMNKVAEYAGYVIFKDSKVVVFYSNDLALTPTEPILSTQNESAIEAVRDLAVIKRWVDMKFSTE